jgi:hypothetical protein
MQVLADSWNSELHTSPSCPVQYNWLIQDTSGNYRSIYIPMAYSFMVPVEILPLIFLTFLAFPRTWLALILAPSNYLVCSICGLLKKAVMIWQIFFLKQTAPNYSSCTMPTVFYLLVTLANSLADSVASSSRLPAHHPGQLPGRSSNFLAVMRNSLCAGSADQLHPAQEVSWLVSPLIWPDPATPGLQTFLNTEYMYIHVHTCRDGCLIQISNIQFGEAGGPCYTLP